MIHDSDNESGYVEHELVASISNNQLHIVDANTQTSPTLPTQQQSFDSERYEPSIFDIMATEAARNVSTMITDNERYLIDQDCVVGLTDCAKSELLREPPKISKPIRMHSFDDLFEPVTVSVEDDTRSTSHQQLFSGLSMPDDKPWLTGSTDNMSHTVRREVEIVEHEVNQVRHVIRPTTALDESLDQQNQSYDEQNSLHRRRKLPLVPRNIVPRLPLEDLTNTNDDSYSELQTTVTDNEGTNTEFLKSIRRGQSNTQPNNFDSIKLNPSSEIHEQKPGYLQEYQDYIESFEGTGSTARSDNVDNSSQLEDSVFLSSSPPRGVLRGRDSMHNPSAHVIFDNGIKSEATNTGKHFSKRNAYNIHSPAVDKILVNITHTPNGERSRTVTTITQRPVQRPLSSGAPSRQRVVSDKPKVRKERDASPERYIKVQTKTENEPPWRRKKKEASNTRDFTTQTPSHQATQTPLRVNISSTLAGRTNGQPTSLLDTFVIESGVESEISRPVTIMPWDILTSNDLEDNLGSRDFSTQTFGQSDEKVNRKPNETRAEVESQVVKNNALQNEKKDESDKHKKSSKSKKRSGKDGTSNAASNSNKGDILKYMLSQVRELRSELIPTENNETKNTKKSKAADKKKIVDNDSDSAIDSLDEDPDKYTNRRLELLYKSRQPKQRKGPHRRHSDDYSQFDDRHTRRSRHDNRDNSRSRHNDDYRSRRYDVPQRRAYTPSPPRRTHMSPSRHEHDRHGSRYTPRPHTLSANHGYPRPRYQQQPLHPAYRQQTYMQPRPVRQVSRSVPPRPAPMQNIQLAQNTAFRPIQHNFTPTPAVISHTPNVVTSHRVTPHGVTPQQGLTPMVLLPNGQMGHVAQQPQSSQQPYIVIASPYRYDSESNVEQNKPHKQKSKRPKTPMEVSLHQAARAASRMKDITENITKKQH